MIAQARKLVEVPILVAGGVKTPESVSSLIKAGADIVQVGSIFEKAQGDLKKCGELFNKITTAARNAGKEKLK